MDNEEKESSRAASDGDPKGDAGYRYYLEDHPFLGPAITLLLGGFCLYATVFSNLLRDVLVGAGGSTDLIFNFNRATGWMVAFVVGIMAITFIFLLINLGEAGVRVARRRPAICPNCETTEGRGNQRFKHERIKFTQWENITCSECGHTWHGRQ